MKVLVIGANGFIGSRLCEKILQETDWQIAALDLHQNNLESILHHERFDFHQADMRLSEDWMLTQIKACDVLLPLAAIATPATYVNDPLRIFELDFEANLKLIRLCVKEKKHIIFPSTSEVYGMSADVPFDEESSNFVVGPTNKERWIYSNCKQLLDRLIFAYGKHEGLSYTLFRPFNWFGPRLDNILDEKKGASRVLTQFIGNILRGQSVVLVDGGEQKRCFTYLDDGIDALMQMIRLSNGIAKQKIYNVGNPDENFSIRYLAELLIQLIGTHYPQYADKAKAAKIEIQPASEYFGAGYQDVQLRVPSIERARSDLNWSPKINLESGLRKTLDFYLK